MILSNKKVLNYIFYKHNVNNHESGATIRKISEKLIGLHSARLITPYSTLAARIPSFRTIDLYKEVIDRSNLIKLRCMRKTLHTVTLEDAPIVHMATKNMRMTDCYSFYKKNNYSESQIKRLKKDILAIVATEGRGISYIINILENKYDVSLIRIVVKDLWEEGILCYQNMSKNWGKEDRIYNLTSKVYPSLKLESIDVSTAQEKLILKHIDNYGPVSLDDISWWSGIPKRVVEALISRIGELVIKVKLDIFEFDFYMTKSDFLILDTFDFKSINNDWFALLAYEDSTLKGYYNSRLRYVDKENYKHLFNSIGEARASVIMNGKVVGTWVWNKKALDIELTMFLKLTMNQHTKLMNEVSKIKKCLLGSSYTQLNLIKK